MMRRLKLTVNKAKTRVCHLPEERFDFLGYSFGRYYSPQTGRTYLCPWPSKRSVQRLIGAIREATERRTQWLEADEVVRTINRKLLGWANYFSLGPTGKAYRTINEYTAASAMPGGYAASTRCATRGQVASRTSTSTKRWDSSSSPPVPADFPRAMA